MCRFHVATGWRRANKLSLTARLLEHHAASGHHLQSYWLLPLLTDIPWFLTEEKHCCYIHHTFLLGFPTGRWKTINTVPHQWHTSLTPCRISRLDEPFERAPSCTNRATSPLPCIFSAPSQTLARLKFHQAKMSRATSRLGSARCHP
jgi:hypothetical protein